MQVSVYVVLQFLCLPHMHPRCAFQTIQQQLLISSIVSPVFSSELCRIFPNGINRLLGFQVGKAAGQATTKNHLIYFLRSLMGG